VVTPERFAKGVSYAEYRSSAAERGPAYDENYNGTTVSEADVKAFKELMAQPDGPAKVLVLTEHWCPDCHREVPVVARLAEATGMDMKIFLRDENKDIMSEFKKDGEFESIPVFVFYTKDHKYITHFIERSKYANEHMSEMRAGTENMTPEQRAEHSAKFRAEKWGDWRNATIQQLKETFTKK